MRSLLERLEAEDPRVVRVVISDNCSDDPGYAAEVAPRCARHRLEVLYHRQGATRPVLDNFTWLSQHAASTAFACFLGDDDYWEEGALTRIVRAMRERDIDFSYARDWTLHDRDSGAVTARFSMHPLHDDPVANLQEFIRYGNDPHVYGVFRSPLLAQMCAYFTPRWRMLPRSHIIDAAFTSVAFAYLAAKRIEWLPYRHSQGVAAGAHNDNAFMRLARGSGLRSSLYYGLRKPQLYASYMRLMSQRGHSLKDRARVTATCLGSFMSQLPLIARR